MISATAPDGCGIFRMLLIGDSGGSSETRECGQQVFVRTAAEEG